MNGICITFGEYGILVGVCGEDQHSRLPIYYCQAYVKHCCLGTSICPQCSLNPPKDSTYLNFDPSFDYDSILRKYLVEKELISSFDESVAIDLLQLLSEEASIENDTL